ncbi:glycoside hydrolase family 5 protein [Streptomyces griseorubiginosus]|uniref:glycoside hydrolase family 5 protein n=1 Tax=Streptomyces griseorubiginosus TaxID=67304 RepID=UPI0033C2B40D
MQRTRYLTGGRGLGRLLGLLLTLVTMIGVTSTAAFGAPAPEGPLPIRLPVAAASPADTVAAMQPSWNLGNTFDAIPDVTSWGNDVPTKSLFDALKAQGYRSVRIPVTWTDHQSATAPYVIDAAWMTSVKKAVDLALNDGLYVVINVHHDSWQWIADMPTNHDGVLARFKATWTQIAATFRNHPQKLLFEGNNEPQFNNTTEAQGIQYNAELNSAFRTVVRQSGGNNATRLLFLPTLGCTPSQERMDPLAAQLKSMNDPNLAATVHYYGYYPFSVNIAGGTRFDATSQQDMTDAFTRIRTLFVTQGIPTYLGEYGLLGYPDSNHPSRVEQGEALKYYEMLGHSARTAGATTALWDAGSWNYFNRTSSSGATPAWAPRSGPAGPPARAPRPRTGSTWRRPAPSPPRPSP